jgi:selenium-binding protein 1
MVQWTPDPTFYPSPQLASEAPPEKLAYVALLGSNGGPDGLGVVDVDPSSSTYSELIYQLDMPNGDNELHHLGWNACSSHLCPYAAHAHVERRYLVLPGLKSTRIHLVDTKPDPRRPQIAKVIEPEEVFEKTGYRAIHTSHCGPEGIFLNGLGGVDGEGPSGIFTLDHDTFEVNGPWESDREDQYLGYDFWWHLGHDTMVTSEWGTPNMVEAGLNPDILLGGNYGHALHVWDLHTRKHKKRLDLGSQYQMVLVLCPAHDPRKAYGFVGVVVSLEDLSSSIWMWYLDSGNGNGTGDWKVKKVIDVPAEPADADDLPPMLKGFGAVPPLVTATVLSLDDQFLYVSCWGTGELIQYDVSDPFNPVRKSSVKIGGIVDRTPHPARPDKPLSGGPQMVEASRVGKRVYITSSLYSTWDPQFYPDGVDGWMAKLDVTEDGLKFDEDFFLEFEPGTKPHQVRLEGGDASSDSFCLS